MWAVCVAVRVHTVPQEVGDVDVHFTVQRVLEHCAEGLRRRGNGEEKYLDPLFARLEARRNPGQIARDVFVGVGASASDAAPVAGSDAGVGHGLDGDMASLVKHLAVPSTW